MPEYSWKGFTTEKYIFLLRAKNARRIFYILKLSCEEIWHLFIFLIKELWISTKYVIFVWFIRIVMDKVIYSFIFLSVLVDALIFDWLVIVYYKPHQHLAVFLNSYTRCPINFCFLSHTSQCDFVQFFIHLIPHLKTNKWFYTTFIYWPLSDTNSFKEISSSWLKRCYTGHDHTPRTNSFSI